MLVPYIWFRCTIMRKIFPRAKDEKNTFELLGEIYGQTILTLVLIVFIHRIVTHIFPHIVVCPLET